jgi:hypothetical protein
MIRIRNIIFKHPVAFIYLEKRTIYAALNATICTFISPPQDEGTGGWRKLCNEELHNLYSSSSIMRMISQGG